MKLGATQTAWLNIANWAIEAPRAYASEAKSADALARRLRAQGRQGISQLCDNPGLRGWTGRARRTNQGPWTRSWASTWEFLRVGTGQLDPKAAIGSGALKLEGSWEAFMRSFEIFGVAAGTEEK